MPRPVEGLAVAATLGVLLWAQSAAAQSYDEDAPPPPNAKGDVLSLKGEVLPVKGEVLEIRGIASGLAARVDPVQAALRDLGATVKAKEIKINLSADVLFDFDKADLRPEAGPSLAKVAEVLKAYPRAATLIEGHTDGKGTDQYNQPLSERRAEAVRRWLAANGVGAKMTTRGWGKAKPVAPNIKPGGADDPEGRQKNRRVEITVRTQ
ncbi:MAG: OmpA family protein [Xanthobacteraceae bacterium]|jgi:outer membrane protein OmpA-like peptidoglycan-associated protein